MQDQDKDVNEEEETSTESSTEETSDEERVAEEESSEDKESEDEAESEETEEKSEESEEEDPKATIAKLSEQVQNLTKALQTERSTKKQAAKAPVRQPLTKGSDDPISKRIVESNEQRALKSLYGEFPHLAPSNDPDNILFTKFQRGFKVLIEDKGAIPVTYEDILEQGREVMSIIAPNTSTSSKKSEDKKEEAKTEAANLGTGSSSKRKERVSATESDRRAAAAVGMSLEDYLKNKDTFVDEVPI